MKDVLSSFARYQAAKTGSPLPVFVSQTSNLLESVHNGDFPAKVPETRLLSPRRDEKVTLSKSAIARTRVQGPAERLNRLEAPASKVEVEKDLWEFLKPNKSKSERPRERERSKDAALLEMQFDSLGVSKAGIPDSFDYVF